MRKWEKKEGERLRRWEDKKVRRWEKERIDFSCGSGLLN
jgi:hypothetical protein